MRLFQGLFERESQRLKPGFDAASEMNPQRAPVTIGPEHRGR